MLNKPQPMLSIQYVLKVEEALGIPATAFALTSIHRPPPPSRPDRDGSEALIVWRSPAALG